MPCKIFLKQAIRCQVPSQKAQQGKISQRRKKGSSQCCEYYLKEKPSSLFCCLWKRYGVWFFWTFRSLSGQEGGFCWAGPAVPPFSVVEERWHCVEITKHMHMSEQTLVLLLLPPGHCFHCLPDCCTHLV